MSDDIPEQEFIKRLVKEAGWTQEEAEAEWLRIQECEESDE